MSKSEREHARALQLAAKVKQDARSMQKLANSKREHAKALQIATKVSGSTREHCK